MLQLTCIIHWQNILLLWKKNAQQGLTLFLNCRLPQNYRSMMFLFLINFIFDQLFACLIINIFMHDCKWIVIISNFCCCCNNYYTVYVIHWMSLFINTAFKTHCSNNGIIVNTEPLLCYQVILAVDATPLMVPSASCWALVWDLAIFGSLR